MRVSERMKEIEALNGRLSGMKDEWYIETIRLFKDAIENMVGTGRSASTHAVLPPPDAAWCGTGVPKRECWCEKCMGGIPNMGDAPTSDDGAVGSSDCYPSPATLQPADIVEEWMQDNKMGCGILVQSEKNDLNNRLKFTSQSDALIERGEDCIEEEHLQVIADLMSQPDASGLVRALEDLIQDCELHRVWHYPCLSCYNAIKALAAYKAKEGKHGR